MNFYLLVTTLVTTVTAAQIQSIPNQYIVTFKEISGLHFDAQVDTFAHFIQSNGLDNQVIHTYDSVLSGVAVKLDQATLNLVKHHPIVDDIEPDQIATTLEEQTNAPWGLARLSQHEKLIEGQYTYRYNSTAGQGVNIYILDTGVNVDHDDFEGRATWGFTTAKDATDVDKHGHGTHCAGTTASKTYGVAKRAHVIAVKVMGDNGQGAYSDIIAGINWVVKNKSGPVGNVISMSIGGGPSSALDKTINKAVERGIVAVVAAGNEHDDACKGSPSRAKRAITVGATSVEDSIAYFSNFGKCVNILAPGVRILSTWIGSNKATNIISGTSMATPHIAGLSAALLSEGVAPNKLKKRLVSLGTKKAISGVPKKTPNVLAFNGFK